MRWHLEYINLTICSELCHICDHNNFGRDVKIKLVSVIG